MKKRVIGVVGHTENFRGVEKVCSNGRVLTEYDWNIEIAERLGKDIKDDVDYNVICGGYNDVSYNKHFDIKINMINKASPNLVVFLHCNSYHLWKVNGSEVWCNQLGSDVAIIFQKHILKNLKLKDRHIKYGVRLLSSILPINNRIWKMGRNLKVLKDTKYAAVLIEPFFMNGTYGDCLQYDCVKKLYIDSLSGAIKEYFNVSQGILFYAR